MLKSVLKDGVVLVVRFDLAVGEDLLDVDVLFVG